MENTFTINTFNTTGNFVFATFTNSCSTDGTLIRLISSTHVVRELHKTRPNRTADSTQLMKRTVWQLSMFSGSKFRSSGSS
ncbi:hypothetical protein C0J52_27376 [Blattella germanica]|nr:hypothetical protein C0J52_27376 [Blattella germanica]